MLTLTAQRRASAQRCSSPLPPLFMTLTASHRCAPPLPPITGRANQSAVRLAEMSTDRNGSDCIRTEANFGRIRTGSECIFFQNWRIRTGADWENFCCFNV